MCLVLLSCVHAPGDHPPTGMHSAGGAAPAREFVGRNSFVFLGSIFCPKRMGYGPLTPHPPPLLRGGTNKQVLRNAVLARQPHCRDTRPRALFKPWKKLLKPWKYQHSRNKCCSHAGREGPPHHRVREKNIHCFRKC